MASIELVERFDDAILLITSHATRVFEIQNRIPFRAKNRTLIVCRHKSRRPVFGPRNRTTSFIEHHDIARKILINITQAIVHPTSERRFSTDERSGIHFQHRRAMDGRFSGKRMKKGDVIDAGREMWEEIRNPLTTLAILLEIPFWLNDTAFIFFPTTPKGFHLHRLSIHPLHSRFVIEGIDVRWPAIHKEKNYALCLRGKISLLLLSLGHHPRQSERGKASSNSRYKFPPVSLSAKVSHD